MSDVFLYDAVRTPRGKARPDGGLAGLQPYKLVGQCIAAIDTRTGGGARTAQALLLGCVGQVSDQGANIALVSKLHAGLPDTTSAWTINNYCVSALTAIGQGAMIARGGAPVLAGGVEMMSRVPFMADRAGYYTDTGFAPRHRYTPVAVAADRMAAATGIDRAALDAVALASQSRAAATDGDAALQASRITVTTSDGVMALSRDETVRATTAEKLAAMEPAFGELIVGCADALGGETVIPLHTVAHAPPMCDAAAMVLVGVAGAMDAAPRARIVAFVESGGDPHASLSAGFAAMARVLDQSGLTLDDMDRIEFMEAFGVTIARFLRDYSVDPDRVNVSGGHLARGHPMGASGAILVSTLLDTLDVAGGRYGLVVASGASGVGSAMIVERIN